MDTKFYRLYLFFFDMVEDFKVGDFTFTKQLQKQLSEMSTIEIEALVQGAEGFLNFLRRYQANNPR